MYLCDIPYDDFDDESEEFTTQTMLTNRGICLRGCQKFRILLAYFHEIPIKSLNFLFSMVLILAEFSALALMLLLHQTLVTKIPFSSLKV